MEGLHARDAMKDALLHLDAGLNGIASGLHIHGRMSFHFASRIVIDDPVQAVEECVLYIRHHDTQRVCLPLNERAGDMARLISEHFHNPPDISDCRGTDRLRFIHITRAQHSNKNRA